MRFGLEIIVQAIALLVILLVILVGILFYYTLVSPLRG